MCGILNECVIIYCFTFSLESHFSPLLTDRKHLYVMTDKNVRLTEVDNFPFQEIARLSVTREFIACFPWTICCNTATSAKIQVTVMITNTTSKVESPTASFEDTALMTWLGNFYEVSERCFVPGRVHEEVAILSLIKQ